MMASSMAGGFMQQIVFLDSDTLDTGINLRRPDFPHHWQSYPTTAPDQVVERLKCASIAIINKVRIGADELAQLPELRLIALAATGSDNLDLEACRAANVAVCNIRNYADNSVAEHTLMLMLALRRKLLDYQRSVAAGEWQRADQFCLMQHPIQDLAGATLGIVGKGALGESVARLARAFGMHVLFAERKQARLLRNGYTPFDEVLQSADVLSLHCPLTEATRQLIGARELAQMKPGAILINTARGALVDAQALAGALSNYSIAGAGIDVLEHEPPQAGSPLLAPLPNLIVTPHCAWLGSGALAALAEQLIGNIEAFLRGEARNLVT